MTLRSRFMNLPTTPQPSSRKMQTVAVSFKGGIKTYPANDDIDYDELLLAQDVRMVRIGTYQTRKGVNGFVDAIGKAQAMSIASSNTDVISVGDKQVLKQSFTTTAAFRLWSIELNLSAATSASGYLRVEIYESENNTPTVRIAETTVNVTDLSQTQNSIEAKFLNAPDLDASTEYFIILRTQENSAGPFEVGVGTDLSGAMFSDNGGEFWTDPHAGLLFNLNSATAGEVRNVWTANNNGTLTTFFLFNNILYRTDALGNVTIQNDALPAGVKNIYFSQSQLAVRYAYGLGEARKIDLTDFSETEIEAGRGGARNLFEHKSSLFYLSDGDPNGVYSSQAQPDIDSFDTERSFIAEIPSPNCGDDIAAMAELGGVLYFLTRRNKYALFGDGWQSFSVDDAATKKGTFSQDSVTADTNFIYYASDTGIYSFDGTSDIGLSDDSVQDVWDRVLDKTTCKLDIHDGRLYVFYSDRPTKECNKCLVYNLDLRIWESFDTDTWVGSTNARKHPTGRFIQGSSRVGALFFAEENSNNFNNLGAPLHAELATAYMAFKSPAQLKRMTKLRPEFETSEKNYEIECGFSKDFSEDVKFAFSLNLSSGGVTWNSGRLWDNGEIWAGDKRGARMTTKPYVYGDFRRVQIRYKHHAVGEPMTFISHTMVVQTQRIR